MGGGGGEGNPAAVKGWEESRKLCVESWAATPWLSLLCLGTVPITEQDIGGCGESPGLHDLAFQNSHLLHVSFRWTAASQGGYRGHSVYFPQL